MLQRFQFLIESLGVCFPYFNLHARFCLLVTNAFKTEFYDISCTFQGGLLVLFINRLSETVCPIISSLHRFPNGYTYLDLPFVFS